MSAKTLTFEGTYKNLPFLKEFFDANPQFTKCQDMYRSFRTFLNMYIDSKYKMVLDVNTDIGTACGQGLGIDSAETAEAFISMYENDYNAFQNAMKKKG